MNAPRVTFRLSRFEKWSALKRGEEYMFYSLTPSISAFVGKVIGFDPGSRMVTLESGSFLGVPNSSRLGEYPKPIVSEGDRPISLTQSEVAQLRSEAPRVLARICREARCNSHLTYASYFAHGGTSAGLLEKKSNSV